MRKYYQGYFKPNHPEKYIGDINKIFFRSNWEKKFMLFCDTSENVIYWNSEGVAIDYFDEFDHKSHKYYPDFLLQIKTKENIIKNLLIEIKPERQTIPPTGKRMTKRLVEDIHKYTKNTAKWDAARRWCAENNTEFQILTEQSLGIA